MAAPASRPVYAVAGLFEARRRALTLPSGFVRVFPENLFLGNRSCQVLSLTTQTSDYLQISGAGRFSISHGKAQIDFDPEPDAAEEAVMEALLGPALALSLARRGIFLLHAGAVVLQGVVHGLLGESGAGKSTLTGLLAGEEGIALAADDLLAVALTPEGAEVLPHVPQLKLAPEAMAAIESLPPRLPLAGLYALAPAPPEADAVLGEPLPPAEAATLLIRHTIAGILFPEDLLAAHFAFVTDLAGRVPVRRLTVPRRLDVGPEVLRELR
jgi:hypothetical protein